MSTPAGARAFQCSRDLRKGAGGHHERDRRAGTENVPGIAALGAAAELAGRTLAAESERLPQKQAGSIELGRRASSLLKLEVLNRAADAVEL